MIHYCHCCQMRMIWMIPYRYLEMKNQNLGCFLWMG
jgi:hypothetical protein